MEMFKKSSEERSEIVNPEFQSHYDQTERLCESKPRGRNNRTKTCHNRGTAAKKEETAPRASGNASYYFDEKMSWS